MASDIPATDISDKQILDKTGQKNGAGDTMQLSYVLPSGRKLTSEFFKKDQGAKALIAWCNVVREQMLADAQDARDQARQAAIEEKARKAREAAGLLVGTDGDALSAEPMLPALPSSAMAMPRSSASPVGIASPDEFIQQMLNTAERELAHAQAEAEAATMRYAKAAESLQKWRALAVSLNAQSRGLTNGEKSEGTRLGPAVDRGVVDRAGESVPVKRTRRPRKKATAVVITEGSKND